MECLLVYGVLVYGTFTIYGVERIRLLVYILVHGVLVEKALMCTTLPLSHHPFLPPSSNPRNHITIPFKTYLYSPQKKMKNKKLHFLF